VREQELCDSESADAREREGEWKGARRGETEGGERDKERKGARRETEERDGNRGSNDRARDSQGKWRERRWSLLLVGYFRNDAALLSPSFPPPQVAVNIVLIFVLLAIGIYLYQAIRTGHVPS